MTLLVVLDHDRGAWNDANDEALTAARMLANDMSVDIHVAMIGQGGDELAERATAGGADVLHHVTDPLLDDYGPETWGQSIVALAQDLEPEAVMAIGTDRGNEVMAQAAARLDLAFVANCLSVDCSGSGDDPDVWVLTRAQWGGSLLEDVGLAGAMKFLTFGHHAVVAEESDEPGEGEVASFEPELDELLARTVVADRQVLTSGVTLATAPVVVSGGRGVGSADGFGILEELAGLLGGRVGCSRAVTNNGWRNHSDQVGQTGTRIAPEIYIATGISGAIQHFVGAAASKRILAINTDPEANMVVKADYAVVGDLHKVVPAISEEIRRRK